MAMVVVFPEPLIPTKTMTQGSFAFRFSSTASTRSLSPPAVRVSNKILRRVFSTVFFRSSNRLTLSPSSLFSISVQMWSATETATSFSMRVSLKSQRMGRRLSDVSSVVVILPTRLLSPSLSLSNRFRPLPLAHLRRQVLKLRPAIPDFLYDLV